jgi:hypothetical protein
MTINRALTLQARALLLQSAAVDAPCPETMIGSMASIPLPPPAVGSPAHRLDRQGLHDWFRERNVETWLYPHPVPLLRVSAQLYNNLATMLLPALVLGSAGTQAVRCPPIERNPCRLSLTHGRLHQLPCRRHDIGLARKHQQCSTGQRREAIGADHPPHRRGTAATLDDGGDHALAHTGTLASFIQD